MQALGNSDDGAVTSSAAPVVGMNDARIRAELDKREESWWKRLNRFQRSAVIALEFVVIAVLWEILIGRLELISPLFFPPPSRIALAGYELFSSGEIFPHLRVSAFAWFIGYFLAVLIGVICGFLMGGWKPFGKLAGPVIWLIYAAPWIAFQPLFAVWFGFGATPVIFMVVTAAVFAVIFNTAAGVSTVDRYLLRCASVFGAGTVARYRKVVFPAVLPFIFVGLRHAAVIATLGLLAGEITTTTVGMGALITIKTAQFQVASAFVVIVLTVVFTTIVGQLLTVAARRVAPWHFAEGTR
jgi:ABC-type nitrate/sulfonate/bicarbonate transport system permease component